MNRLLTLMLIGLASLLASCGSSVSSSTQPAIHESYSMLVSPDQFTLNSGDWSSITATVQLSVENGTPHAVSPQPTVKFYSSDSRVSISSGGEVCAGQWDTRYLTCTPNVFPAKDPTTGLANANAGQLNIPSGYVTITAYDSSHNVTGTTRLSIHPRAASITLSVDASSWNSLSAPSGKCISQDLTAGADTSSQVKYVAHALDVNGNPITAYDNDYTWSVDDSTVAAVSNYGYVTARNSGVTNVVAKLNGTISAPLTFVTCPPKSILIQTTPYTGTALTTKTVFTTSDLVVPKGNQQYVQAVVTDYNNHPTCTTINSQSLESCSPLSLSYITSTPLIGSLVTSSIPLTGTLTTSTAGEFTMMAACGPTSCNPAVADFTLPTGTHLSARDAGFGYPVYSNVIGVTVTGITPSTVLVTNSVDSASIASPLHRLLAFDSESLQLTHTVELANLPNSMVVAPNGSTAYLGSSDGLVVVNLSSYQSSIQTYPIVGGISTDFVTGKVLAVSPDSRYVVVSDGTVVYLIDTVTTKTASRKAIPGITTAAFAPDNSSFWIGGTSGVYEFVADTFVALPNSAGTGVKAMAWTPDGQSFFASGDTTLVNYSTCDDQSSLRPATSVPLGATTSGPINLDATAIGGVPRIFGLAGNQWLDYSVLTSAQVGSTLSGGGNVCQSTVSVNAPTITPSTLNCAITSANQGKFHITYSPALEREYITGVDPSCASASTIHGYDVSTKAEIASSITTNTPVVPLSGDVLSDGRYLYFGTYDSTNGGLLHRINLATGTEDSASTTATNTTTNVTTTTITIPASVGLVPSFVAVVPK